MRRSKLFLFLGALLLAPVAGAEALVLEGVAKRSVAREHRFDGVVEAVHQATISAQTSGRVQEILFDVDDVVTKGDVVLRFRDAEQRAGLARAEASLTEAEARAREAESEYRRIREVYEKKLVAKSALDKASAERKAAGARLEAARAGVEQAREQLEYTVVRAPYSGIVVKRHVEVGESANPGQPLISGISLERLRVTTHLPQRLMDPVRRFGRGRVIIGNGPGTGEARVIDAEKLTVFPQSDPVTHTFTVRLQLPEGVAGLYPGMFVKAAFITGENERLVVPASAVVRRGEVTGVYVVAADGRISLRQVRVGRAVEGGVVVLAGLAEGEQVALDPIRAGVELKRREAGETP